MFINYAKNAITAPINRAAARILLGVYTLWKLISYDWFALDRYPGFMIEQHPSFLLPSPSYAWITDTEIILLFLLVTAFIVGYMTKYTGFASSLLLAHLAASHYVITSFRVFFTLSHFYILFSLFSDEDILSIDGFRSGKISKKDLKRALTGNGQKCKAQALQWSLVYFALIYFLVAFDRLASGAVRQWANPENLMHIMKGLAIYEAESITLLSEAILSSPSAITAINVATLLLELGFLAVVLLKKPTTPIVLGLFGMHIAIALTLGHVFSHFIVFHFLFFDWKRPAQFILRRLPFLS